MEDRLNILWLSLEDSSPRLGCYGDRVARTPHLDRLAREGCVYRNGFSTAPVCAPARSAVITGMYAASIGAQHMRVRHNAPPEFGRLPSYECVPPPQVKLLPEYLRGAGYFCSNNEKMDYQFACPFTAWDENGPEAHWRRRAAGQPFFSVFNFLMTHESGMWAEHGPGSIVEHERAEPQTDPAVVTVPPYLPDTPEVRKSIARQYDNLERDDKRVGEILRQLDEDGLAGRTLVIVWSDHGEGLPRGKRFLYDSGLRVPLIVRWPGRMEPGTVSDQLVSTIDLAPTVLRAAGVSVPVHLQGKPFAGPEVEERRHVFATRDRFDEFYDCQRAVRDGRYKYIRTYHPELGEALWSDYACKHPAMREIWRLRREGALPEQAEFFFRHPRPPEELYDTLEDPWETNNLAGEPSHADRLAELRLALDAWQREIGDLFAEPEESMVRRFWPDGRQPVTHPPLVVVHDAGNRGTPAGVKSDLCGPALVQLHAPTQGSSLGYRWDDDLPGTWRLYTVPFDAPPGHFVLEAKAIRIGFRESTPVRVEFSVDRGK